MNVVDAAILKQAMIAGDLMRLHQLFRGKLICAKCKVKPRISFNFNVRQQRLDIDMWCHGKFISQRMDGMGGPIVEVHPIVFPGDLPELENKILPLGLK